MTRITSPRWSLNVSSTAISSGSLTLKKGFTQSQRARILGFNWATASSMGSTVYFRIVVDGSTLVSDPVGARFSGYVADPGGIGITATVSLVASFTSSAAGGGVSGFYVWGEWA